MGYTVGGGFAVEWRGTKWGCVKARVADRPWTEWFALPFIDYGDAPLPVPKRTLRRGSSGAEVMELQKALNSQGKDGRSVPPLQMDGVFGKLTEAAVRAFQRNNGLKADGICGPVTWAAVNKNPEG